MRYASGIGPIGRVRTHDLRVSTLACSCAVCAHAAPLRSDPQPSAAGATGLASSSAGGAGQGAVGVGGWVDASLGKTLQGPDGEGIHKIAQAGSGV